MRAEVACIDRAGLTDEPVKSSDLCQVPAMSNRRWRDAMTGEERGPHENENKGEPRQCEQ